MTNIEFENIFNIRDIGGQITKEKKQIKRKRLIRSACPYNASKLDIYKLKHEYNIKYVVDFRSYEEIEKQPVNKDMLKGIKYLCFPVVKNWKKFSKSNKIITNSAIDTSIEHIKKIYEKLPTWQDCQEAYKQFLSLLLEINDGAVLWHCSWGKDRTGVASLLIEHLLDVSWKNIYENYLETNDYYNLIVKTKEIDKNLASYFTDPTFIARKKYLDSMLGAINKKYSSLDDYITKVYNIDAIDINNLKIKFLDDKF